MASYGAPPPQPGGGDAQQQVQGPAMALMIVNGVFVILQIIAFFAAPAMMSGFFAHLQQEQVKAGQPVTIKPEDLKPGPLNYALLVVMLVGTGLGIFGAMKMRTLESYGLAMTGSIVSMIPYVSPCCCLGLPFGIWAIVVLSKPEVKAAFRS